MWCNGSIRDLGSCGAVRIWHFQSRDIYQMEDGRAHNPEVAGSNPAPATQRLMIRRKTMLSTMIREFKMIQNKLQFWCINKNWIICDVFIRSCGLERIWAANNSSLFKTTCRIKAGGFSFGKIALIGRAVGWSPTRWRFEVSPPARSAHKRGVHRTPCALLFPLKWMCNLAGRVAVS